MTSSVISDTLDQKCAIERVANLLAIHCPGDYFRIIDLSASLEDEASVVYETTKAVQQIRASKLEDDPFISFMEASQESQTTVPPYANLKVVDYGGVRSIGVSSLVPSMSIYLGGDLIMEISNTEVSMRLYSPTESSYSSYVSKVSEPLSIDYYPLS